MAAATEIPGAAHIPAADALILAAARTPEGDGLTPGVVLPAEGATPADSLTITVTANAAIPTAGAVTGIAEAGTRPGITAAATDMASASVLAMLPLTDMEPVMTRMDTGQATERLILVFRAVIGTSGGAGFLMPGVSSILIDVTRSTICRQHSQKLKHVEALR